LPVPHRHAADPSATQLSRLHALPHEHPRLQHRPALHLAVTMSIRHGIATLALLALGIARVAVASPIDDYDLGASVTTGYRDADVAGSNGKYREDYNLRSGFELFNLDVGGTAKDPVKSSLDHFHLLVETPGDEPVSTYLFDAGDRQRW